ncbi:hypothetical protein ACFL6U_24090 [Planctomycetota bacterium]
MKTRRRELFLLVCYFAALLPTTVGNVLCIHRCGLISVVPANHHGHDDTHEHHHGDSNCNHSPTPIDPVGEVVEHHAEQCCVDIPLATDSPQITIKPIDRSLWTCSINATITTEISRHNTDTPVATFYTPPDTCGLTSIVLLI